MCMCALNLLTAILATTFGGVKVGLRAAFSALFDPRRLASVGNRVRVFLHFRMYRTCARSCMFIHVYGYLPGVIDFDGHVLRIYECVSAYRFPSKNLLHRPRSTCGWVERGAREKDEQVMQVLTASSHQTSGVKSEMMSKKTLQNSIYSSTPTMVFPSVSIKKYYFWALQTFSYLISYMIKLLARSAFWQKEQKHDVLKHSYTSYPFWTQVICSD